MSRAYYNEHDPKAAAWLRELIKAGLIAPGDVDTRDIQDIKPHELSGYTQQHFFAGIGGWSLALRLAGWPDARPVRTGSCPCQPFSAAGLGLGEADPRHLWPFFCALITFGDPTVTFGEQVASAAGRLWLARVRADLEGVGYAVGAADLCSAGLGAPNIRQRLYWVAHAEMQRRVRTPGGPKSSRRDVSATGCHPGGLAHADGRQSRNRDLQRSGQHGQQSQDGGVGGVGDAGDTGLQARERQALRGSRGREEGRAATQPSAASGSERLDDTASDGREQSAEAIQGRRSEPTHAGHLGFWSDYELLPCTDGKARRIEPGSFPLADGVSGRVGLLRGYGNAINPEVAAEFIRATVETLS